MKNVLVVDDSDVDRLLMEGLLNQAPGFTVIAAENGKQALQKLDEWSIDMVLTDLQMPKMDGLELVQEIRNKKLQIPVVLTTGAGSEDVAAAALRAGAAGYIPKNQLNQLLVSTVNEVLDIFTTDQENFNKLLDCSKVSHFEFVLGNDPDLIVELVDFTEQTLRSFSRLDRIDCLRVAIALDQALRNAMFRGNLEIPSETYVPSAADQERGEIPQEMRRRLQQAPYRDRKVIVTMEIKRHGFVVSIRDEGPGFDVADVGNWTEMAARGTKLMQAFMDRVSYHSEGKRVEMAVRFDRQKVEPEQKQQRPAAPSGASPTGRLICQSSGETYNINQEKFVIGQRAACHLRLNGPDVGPLHCMLVVEGDHLMLLNLAPDAQTLLNDKPGNGRRLKTGDEITIGEQKFRFESTNG